jgi:hypothetical protein
MPAMALTLPSGAKIVAATHNAGKARELAALLEGRFEVVTAASLGLPEPEETEQTFTGNALVKARAAADAAGLIALADDSGLSVTALSGAPGIYSARWAGPDRDFGHAMALVEQRLEEIGSEGGGRRPRRWPADLSAARRQGLRLRSDLPAGGRKQHVRRDGRGAEAPLQPPQPRLRQAEGGAV